MAREEGGRKKEGMKVENTIRRTPDTDEVCLLDLWVKTNNGESKKRSKNVRVRVKKCLVELKTGSWGG